MADYILDPFSKCNSSRYNKLANWIKIINVSFSLQARETVKRSADMQKRLEYVHSLQNTVRMNYRQMTEQELTLEEKVCRHKSVNHWVTTCFTLQWVCAPVCVSIRRCWACGIASHFSWRKQTTPLAIVFRRWPMHWMRCPRFWSVTLKIRYLKLHVDPSLTQPRMPRRWSPN